MDKEQKFISLYLKQRFTTDEMPDNECDKEAEFIFQYLEAEGYHKLDEEKVMLLVEQAWNNGIVDYASRPTQEEKDLVLGCTSGKIEGDLLSITNQIINMKGE